jgi:soluble lytic murein transglycosylase-like protein
MMYDRVEIMKTGMLWLALAAPLAAQNVDINTLVFQGSNSIIDKYAARVAEAGTMRANLAELRHRILANPFPIPDVVQEDSYFQMAIRMAAEYDIPKQLFFNLVTAESNWDAAIVSPRGAIGLAQLMPATAEELGVDPWDALENLDGGARYLRQQYDMFGTWELALAAYNAGPGAVTKYDGIPPYAETEDYVKKIMADVVIE